MVSDAWDDLKPSKVTSDDWGTPGWLLELMFPDGKFFDPCPLKGKGKVDGLKSKWPTAIPVFINPPYSRPYPWVEKAANHPGAVALLLPVDPAAEWWAQFSGRFKVTLITQRLKFNRFRGQSDGHHGSVYTSTLGMARAASCVWRKPAPREEVGR
jgi:DNA N-6-adenine-methyltransferase (Dam)